MGLTRVTGQGLELGLESHRSLYGHPESAQQGHPGPPNRLRLSSCTARAIAKRAAQGVLKAINAAIGAVHARLETASPALILHVWHHIPADPMYGDSTSRSSPHDMLARGIRSQMAWTGRLRSLA